MDIKSLAQVSNRESCSPSARYRDTADLLFAGNRESLEEKDGVQAVVYLRRAIELSPDNAKYFLLLAYALFQLGELSESARNFDKSICLEKNPASIIELKRLLFSAHHIYASEFLQGSHAPERQVFMAAAVDLVGAPAASVNILEIGSFAGSSLITWSNAAEKLLVGDCQIVCIDPWGEFRADLYNEKMTKSMKDQNIYQIFCHNASLCPDNVQVTPIRGTSREILPTLDDNKFDLIYIDGSHHYADVLDDLVKCDRLLKKGGIVCGDDLELQLAQCDRAFVEKHKKSDLVKDTKSKKDFHPGVTLAVGEYFGEVSSFSGFWAMRRGSDGYKKVSFVDATGVRPPHWPQNFQDQITAYFKQHNELGKLI